MRTILGSIPAVALCLLLSLAGAGKLQAATETVHWPSYRGDHASGVAKGYATPTEWTDFKWRTALPGLGHSSPVIWGDNVYVTTAVAADKEEALKIGLYGNIEPVEDQTPRSWKVFCLKKSDGTILWQRTAHEGVPKVKRHPKSSHANCTPATDGKHVVCFFGAEGLYCYDRNGELQWSKDFGFLNSGYFRVPEAQWGFASSPVLHDGMVIIQCDVQENSFIAALNIENGSQVWRTARDDVPTWSTPTVDVRPGRSHVIVNGFEHIGGYDLYTGKELWKLSGGGDIPVPTPIVGEDLIYITSAHGRLSPIYAIHAKAKGDISLGPGETRNESIRWSQPRGGNYMQTPILAGSNLYCCRDNGVLTCLDARTGKQLYQARLGSGGVGFTASPVAADGKIYFTNEEGTVYVVKAGSEFELLAKNELGETCMATPALSEGDLFFRMRHHVGVIGSEEKEP